MLDTTLDDQSLDARYAADDKLYVVFYMKAVKNGFKSDEAGRPIFEDVPHVRIHVPGDKTSIIDVPVEEQHKHRFSTRWEKFQKGMTQTPEGTPVEEWPQLTLSQAQEFKALNVYTVEQVAGMSDAATQRFMGGQELKRKAETFLKVSKDTAEAQRLVTENAELNGRLAAQDKQITELAAQVALLMQPATLKGQGRERSSAGTASS